MLLYNDPAVELQWLSHFSTVTSSPFHNAHVSRFWSRAQQCGFDGTNRTPVLRRTPIEIIHVSRQHNNHSIPKDRKQCIARTKAIIASLQSTGHLMLECGLPGETAIRTRWHIAVRAALSKRVKRREVVDGIMVYWATTAGRIHTVAGDQSRGWRAPPELEKYDINFW